MSYLPEDTVFETGHMIEFIDKDKRRPGLITQVKGGLVVLVASAEDKLMIQLVNKSSVTAYQKNIIY